MCLNIFLHKNVVQVSNTKMFLKLFGGISTRDQYGVADQGSPAYLYWRLRQLAVDPRVPGDFANVRSPPAQHQGSRAWGQCTTFYMTDESKIDIS